MVLEGCFSFHRKMESCNSLLRRLKEVTRLGRGRDLTINVCKHLDLLNVPFAIRMAAALRQSTKSVSQSGEK